MFQLIVKSFGGLVKSNSKNREFGRATIFRRESSILTSNFFKHNKNEVWMSHQDSVLKIPKQFKTIAFSKDSKYTTFDVYIFFFHIGKGRRGQPLRHLSTYLSRKSH